MSLLEEALRRQEEYNRAKAAEAAADAVAPSREPRATAQAAPEEPFSSPVEEPIADESAAGQIAAGTAAAAPRPGPERQSASAAQPAPDSASPPHRAVRKPRVDVTRKSGEHNDAAAFAAAAAKLRREEPRAARPNALLMPIIAIIVLLVLLYARKMLVPSQPRTAQSQIGDANSDGVELASGIEDFAQNGISAATANPAVLQEGAATEAAPHGDGTAAGSAPMAAATARQANDAQTGVAAPEPAPKSASPAAPRAIDAKASATNSVSSSATNSVSENVAAAAPAAPEPPQPLVWPLFKLHGIVTGKENLVILDKGEMLSAGEPSKTGVKVESISPNSAVFLWKNERKTLRRGESSDKPADQ